MAQTEVYTDPAKSLGKSIAHSGSAPSKQATLLIWDADHLLEPVELGSRREWTLGRGAMDIVLNSGLVSRQGQGVFSAKPNGWYYTDSVSARNHVLLNGNRLQPGQETLLSHKDILRIESEVIKEFSACSQKSSVFAFPKESGI